MSARALRLHFNSRGVAIFGRAYGGDEEGEGDGLLGARHGCGGGVGGNNVGSRRSSRVDEVKSVMGGGKE